MSMTFYFFKYFFYILGVIFKFLNCLKMLFLIFFNTNYSLFSKHFFHLRPPYKILFLLLSTVCHIQISYLKCFPIFFQMVISQPTIEL